jgi:hypothetical protein
MRSSSASCRIHCPSQISNSGAGTCSEDLLRGDSFYAVLLTFLVMSEDESNGVDESDVADFEEFTQAIQEEQEERQEQVSFEWVETVREAGELWRDVEDVEIVAKETDLSLETTREALTVYRLIFEDPSDVARKASRPSQEYFSLEQELEVGVDEHEEGEPVEDLLREYVGALYLDHDIEELAVGEPPEKETPPMAFDLDELDLDMSELVPSFEIPTSTIAAVANIPKIHDEVFQSQVSALASAVEPGLFRTEKLLASVIQPAIAQQEMALTQSLAPLTAALEEQQAAFAKSTAVMMSEVVQDMTFPDSVLADLAVMQSAMSAAAAATNTPPSSRFEESVIDEASKTSVEAEPLEATGEVVPQTGPVEATLNAEQPDSSKFTTELVVEVPAMVVESMLSTGKARVWFSNLSEDHQLTAVRLLLASVAVYITGNPFVAPIAIIPAPSVRRGIVVDE